MTNETQLVKLIAFKEDSGGYQVLVFRDLESNQYIMCTKLPNWNTRTPSLNECGYLQVREFIAGEDKWYDTNTGEMIPYRYTGVYFWDFVPYIEKQDQDYSLD